jgi:hypothetical protein
MDFEKKKWLIKIDQQQVEIRRCLEELRREGKILGPEWQKLQKKYRRLDGLRIKILIEDAD